MLVGARAGGGEGVPQGVPASPQDGAAAAAPPAAAAPQARRPLRAAASRIGRLTAGKVVELLTQQDSSLSQESARRRGLELAYSMLGAFEDLQIPTMLPGPRVPPRIRLQWALCRAAVAGRRNTTLAEAKAEVMSILRVAICRLSDMDEWPCRATSPAETGSPEQSTAQDGGRGKRRRAASSPEEVVRSLQALVESRRQHARSEVE